MAIQPSHVSSILGQDQTESDTPQPCRKQDRGYRLVIDKNLGHSVSQEKIQTLGAAKLGQPSRPTIRMSSETELKLLCSQPQTHGPSKFTRKAPSGLKVRWPGKQTSQTQGQPTVPFRHQQRELRGQLLQNSLYLHPCLFRVIIRIPANQCGHSIVTELCYGSKDYILRPLPGLQCAGPASLSNLLFGCKAQGTRGNRRSFSPVLLLATLCQGAMWAYATLLKVDQ